MNNLLTRVDHDIDIKSLERLDDAEELAIYLWIVMHEGEGGKHDRNREEKKRHSGDDWQNSIAKSLAGGAPASRLPCGSYARANAMSIMSGSRSLRRAITRIAIARMAIPSP
jgi:hypothetical protein